MQLTQLRMNEHFSKVSASLVLLPAELGCVADPAKAQALLSSPVSHSAMLSGALWLTWGWRCLQGDVLLHSCLLIMKPEDTSRHLSWFWHRLGGDVWDESGPERPRGVLTIWLWTSERGAVQCGVSKFLGAVLLLSPWNFLSSRLTLRTLSGMKSLESNLRHKAPFSPNSF